MKRIQRKRTKGWRMPPNTVYIGRGSKFGNPFVVGEYHPYCTDCDIVRGAIPLTREQCVDYYREIAGTIDLTELIGKDIACWCPVDQVCHGDVLIEMIERQDEYKLGIPRKDRL